MQYGGTQKFKIYKVITKINSVDVVELIFVYKTGKEFNYIIIFTFRW